MEVEFYIKDEPDLFENCNQGDIPRQGDGIIIDEQLYKAFTVIWDYDRRVIKITLERIE